MLTRLETLLEAPLRAALGTAASLVFSAGDKPPDDQKPQLALLVTRLGRAPLPPGSEAEGSREPAYAATTLQLHADAADPRLYPLPPGAASRLAEVQSPPGRLLPQADAWVADAAGLHLLEATAAPVRALLRGTVVKGCQERWAAEVDLHLVAWAAAPGAASDLLGQGLSTVLGKLFELDLVDLQEAAPDGGLSLRLLKPVAHLLEIERRVDTVGVVAWQRLAAWVQLRGELVQCLSLGVPDPTSTIRRIDFGLDRLRADGTQGHDAGSIDG